MVMANEGAIDGIYAPAIDDRLVMSQALISSRACFYTRKDSKWSYAGPRSLEGTIVSVIDDYGYDIGAFDEYVAKAKRDNIRTVQLRTGDTAGETNLKMLLRARFPAMIEHEAVIAYLLKLQGPKAAPQVRNAGCLETPLPLVIGFAKNNPTTPALIKMVDAGVAKLRSSGRLGQLKKKYGVEK